MPGSPEPVIGGSIMTATIAIVLALFLTGGFLYATHKLDWHPFSLFVSGVAGYWITSGSLRLIVLPTHAFQPSHFLQIIPAVLLIGLPLGVLTMISIGLYLSYGYTFPIVGLFATTAIWFFFFLQLGYELEPAVAQYFIGIYFGIIIIVITVIEAFF